MFISYCFNSISGSQTRQIRWFRFDEVSIPISGSQTRYVTEKVYKYLVSIPYKRVTNATQRTRNVTVLLVSIPQRVTNVGLVEQKYSRPCFNPKRVTNQKLFTRREVLGFNPYKRVQTPALAGRDFGMCVSIPISGHKLLEMKSRLNVLVSIPISGSQTQKIDMFIGVTVSIL